MRVWKTTGKEVYGRTRGGGSSIARGPRCTVERLMGELAIEGACARRKRPRTTVPDAGEQPADLLEHDFDASAPNRRWVADPTYVPPRPGGCTPHS
jgi:putative transposase